MDLDCLHSPSLSEVAWQEWYLSLRKYEVNQTRLAHAEDIQSVSRLPCQESPCRSHILAWFRHDSRCIAETLTRDS